MNCLIPKEKLRNSQNMLLTQALFLEYRAQVVGNTEVYTLKEEDTKGCLSMYKVYMASESEYEAAQKLLGSWTHWKKLCGSSWFKPFISAWREEVMVREAAIGKATLIEQAQGGSVAAAKELVGQLTKKAQPGRPSNKVVEDQKAKMKRVDEKVVTLLSRMGNV